MTFRVDGRSPPVIPNGKGAAAVMVAAWVSWVPAVSVVCCWRRYCHVESVHAQKKAQRGNRKQRGAGAREHRMNRLDDGLTPILSNTCIPWYICERKKRLARIGIRRPNSQLGPALRLTTGRDNFYILCNGTNTHTHTHTPWMGCITAVGPSDF